MRVKMLSSLLTIISHKPLSHIRRFCALVITYPDIVHFFFSLSLSFFEPHFSFFSFLSPFFLLICLSRLHLPEASSFASLSGGGSRAPPLSSAR